MIKFVTDFFAAPKRITILETRMNIMTQIVEQLKEAITGLKALVAKEREQVNTKLDTVADEVAELKAKIEELSNGTEQPDFTEVFELLDVLAADIEGIYVEPSEPEVPEIEESEEGEDEVLDPEEPIEPETPAEPFDSEGDAPETQPEVQF